MATLHEVSSSKDGASFIAIGPIVIHKQFNPKTAKNGKLYSTAILKSVGNEIFLTIWGEASKWKLPSSEITLRGKFVRNNYNGSPSLQCDELTIPEGCVEFEASEIQGGTEKPKMKDCIDAGIRAAEYMVRKNCPDLAPAAFTFAANAFMQGIRME